MHLPTLTGLIDRRILINYRCDPAALAAFLPHPFRPKVINGWGMTGICLIRLKAVRPKGLPAFLGITSENGAHRIAVEWEEGGQLQSGVYIPRRDTNSRLNALAGGRVFPGIHHLTRFNVTEKAGNYAISFAGDDGTSLAIHAAKTTQWPDGSVFHNLESASCFFENATASSKSNIIPSGL